LKQEAFAIPIMLGSPYPLFWGFDGSTITFKLDNEVVVYTPTPPINPPHHGWGNIGSRVILCNATETRIMEAQIDNVIINDPLSVDTDFDGKTDMGVYDLANGWWFFRNSFDGNYDFDAICVGGGSQWKPVPGDYDGDGVTDMAVYDQTNGYWFIKYSKGGYGFDSLEILEGYL
jgi:hypothetical protein